MNREIEAAASPSRAGPKAGPLRVSGPVALLVALSSCSACDAMVGADARILSSLKDLEAGFNVPVAGKPPVAVSHAEFREAQVFSDRDGYYVNALVDAAGNTGDTAVNYLGIEHIRFERDRGRWRARMPVLPNLSGLVSTLWERQRALGTRDLAAFQELVGSAYKSGPYDRPAYLARLAVLFQAPPQWLKPVSWAIRVDRGEAQVYEEARSLRDVPPSGPRKERFTLTLERDHWRFTSGLDF